MKQTARFTRFHLISLLLLGALVGASENPLVSLFGTGLLATGVFLCFSFFFLEMWKSKTLYRPIVSLVWPFALLGFVYLQTDIANESPGGSLSRMLQLVVVFSLMHFFYGAARNETKDLFPWYQSACKSMLVLFVLLEISENFLGFGLGFANDNAMGLWLAGVGVLAIKSGANRLAAFSFSVFAICSIYMTGSRTALGAFVGGALLYWAWPVVARRRSTFFAVPVALLVLAYLIVELLANGSASLLDANDISRELSQKNLLSGRDLLWPDVLAMVRQKPWFGWGGDMTGLTSVFEHSVSAHNFYLQILLQAGIVGLTAIVGLIFLVWSRFWALRGYAEIRVAAAAFVALLLSQNFEVTLLQNNLALSLPVWAFIAMSLAAKECRSKPCHLERVADVGSAK